MKYISQINGFWNWRMLNCVSHAEADLYFAIMHCANKSAWKQSFNIPNSTLCNLSGISDASQLNKVRNRLIQLGLIKYSKGKKGSAGTYSVVPLYGEIDVKYDNNQNNNTDNNAIVVKYDNNMDNYLDNNMDNNQDNYSAAILTTYIDKDKDKDKDITVTVTPKPPPEESALSVPKNVITAYEENIGLVSPVILDSVADWLKDTDADVIIWAIGEAKKSGKPSWKYIEGILRNHVNAGRNTLDKILAHNRTFSRDRERQTSVYRDDEYDYDEIEKLMREKYDG